MKATRRSLQQLFTHIFGFFLFFTVIQVNTAAQDFLMKGERLWLLEHAEELFFAPDPSYAPFEFIDTSTGSTSGLAHEYLLLMQKKLGIQFRNTTAASFSEILNLAKARKVAVVNAVTETPDRSAYLLFTPPFIEVPNVIIMRNDRKGAMTLAALAGLKVSAVKGYAVSEFLGKTHPEVQLQLVQNDLQALLMVSYGEADAAILDIASSSYFIDRNGIANLRVAGDTGYPIKLAIGSRNDWPELNSILRKTLEHITEAEREAIRRKWIGLAYPGLLWDRRFWQAMLVLAGLIIVVGAGIIAWNRMLAHQVRLRTKELSSALDGKLVVEAGLKAALREKETLLRELYHRTKNNMSIISSLLELSSENIPETQSKAIFLEMKDRIGAMALIHDMLYSNHNLAEIDIGEYLKRLSTRLLEAYGTRDDRIRVSLDTEAVPVGLSIAVPLAIAVNEALTNSFKHAFPGERCGNITISARNTERGLHVRIADDGAGFPAQEPGGTRHPLGLELIRSIVTDQLAGNVDFEGSDGVSCDIIIPIAMDGGRV